MVTGSTVIPITMANNTSGVITTQDVVAANATAFPQLSAVVKNFDKISWRRLRVRFAPTLPTTAGGSVGMYFDTDRTDAPPTTITQVMQNKGSRMGATWDRQTLPVTAKQLNGINKWYSTLIGTDTTKENTFISPGRIHVLVTSLPGVTFTSNTIVGYIHIDFSAELGFPTNPADTTVPSRRIIPRNLIPVNSCMVDPKLVDIYYQFAAGCLPAPDFYTFLACVDPRGVLDISALSRFDPDDFCYNMNKNSLIPRQEDFVYQFSGISLDGSRRRSIKCEFPDCDSLSEHSNSDVLSNGSGVTSSDIYDIC